MKIRMFYHSLVSDWNHGNAHFLRGVMAELMSRGHDVLAFEPAHGWSKQQLLSQHGRAALAAFHTSFPDLRSEEYDEEKADLEQMLAGVDLVLVHEWTQPAIVAQIGRYRRRHSHLTAFFHDTHHRAVTAPRQIEALSLGDFDAVLAYGRALQQLYLERGFSKNVHIWHEAADTRIFFPRRYSGIKSDVVWIGNWGDEERSAEISDYFLLPADRLSLTGSVYGVRYPEAAVKLIENSGLSYCGWIPNFRVPEIFSAHRMTVHIPRNPYTVALRGIPTIRPFEALSCGVPLISAPWEDVERLFRAGEDFLMAQNPKQMLNFMSDVRNDDALAQSLARKGRETILQRHTCAHRTDELLNIYHSLVPELQLFGKTVGVD